MGSFNVKINLSKLRGVKYFTQEKEQFICIPVKKNFIFNGERGFYIELTANELKEVKFSDTHCLRLSVPKDVYSSLTDEQKKKIPIVGGIQPINFDVSKNDILKEVKFDETPKNAQNIEDDDVPF